VDTIDASVRAVVLVEGHSDRAAVEELARKLERDLDGEGVAIVAMGGASNIFRFLTLYGPTGHNVVVAGLCDAGELRSFQRGLARAGFGDVGSREQMEAVGFFVCDLDLEDELIRALGVSAVEAVIEQQGELASLRIMQRQPAQRGRSAEEHLRRFMGTRARRKIRYGQLLVEALPAEDVPRPLAGVLDWVGSRLPS
jgi:hypothetical protein